MVDKSLAFFCFFVLSASAQVSSRCQLSVHVLSFDGRPIRSPVVVKEQNGRVHEAEHRSNPIKFCDLGILPVDVIVGGDGTCNQILVKHVPMQWDEEYPLRITRDLAACNTHGPARPVPQCEIMLRIMDSADDPIPNAVLMLNGATPRTYAADGYGRIRLFLDGEISLSATVSADRLHADTVELMCSVGSSRQEIVVKLK